LYDKELLNELEEDGLDRGYIALRFTLRLMGCEKAREGLWPNVDEIGRLFQIVDDVLDYEQDVASGEMNCLNSIRRDEYLRQLIEKFAPSETRNREGSEKS
jgi:geranylgeranyl pyrophosphate synthase